MFFRANERSFVTPFVLAWDEDNGTSDDEDEYDVDGVEEPMSGGNQSVPNEHAEENQADGGEQFEEIEYLKIEPDELAETSTPVNDESLKATLDANNERDPFAAGPSVSAGNAEKIEAGDGTHDNEFGHGASTAEVKNESNIEQYGVAHEEDPLAAGPSNLAEITKKNEPDDEIHHDEIEHDASTVKLKDDTFEMDSLRSSLNANETNESNESNESNDCVITAAYYIHDVNVADESNNWFTIIPSNNYAFFIFLIHYFFLMFTTCAYRNVKRSYTICVNK